MHWKSQRESCHLVIINSYSEEKILIRISKENNEFYEKGNWNTIMDESLEAYSKWATIYNENFKIPNNNDRSLHCKSLWPRVK
ncbi:hypothetical protein ACFW04_010667 [Cataglyphis niger]